MELEDIGERLGSLGWLGVGLGAVLLVPALARGLRPVAKGTLKGYMALTDKTREVLAETSERWQDLVAEARAEHGGTVGETSRAAGEPIASLAAGEERAEAHESAGAAEEPKAEARHRRKSAETPSVEAPPEAA